MATYRGVTIKSVYTFNDLGHETISSSNIINIFSPGVEDVDGAHSGGVIAGTSISLDRNDSYPVEISDNGTYYQINNMILSGGGGAYSNIQYGFDAHTYTIPKGSYFGSESTEFYYEGSYDDGSTYSSYEPSTIGINSNSIAGGICFVSPSLSFSSMLSKINGLELYSSDYDNDGEDDYWYSNGYNNMLFYAETDIVYKEYYPSDTNGNSYYYYEYVSGTASYVKGSATASSTSYTVKSVTLSQALNHDDYYVIEPSSVALTPTSPRAGATASIVVSRGTYNGGQASTYGYPITYTYQYSTDGGSTWTTISSTTATTQSFTVPSSAKSIMVRVLSNDSLGTGGYVTSSSYTVTSSITYTSVSGVIKTLNPIVAYGGGYVRLLSQSAKAALSKQAKAVLREQYISRSHCCLKKGA